MPVTANMSDAFVSQPRWASLARALPQATPGTRRHRSRLLESGRRFGLRPLVSTVPKRHERLQVADLELRSQLLQLFDNHVSMACSVVALEAEQARQIRAQAMRELDQRRSRSVVQVPTVDRCAALDIAGPVALPNRLRVAQRLHVQILDASLAQRVAERRLREASSS